jgi:hypothetical protein
MKTETIRVLRPFILDGSPTKVGDVIDVPAVFAIELRTAKKAEKVVPPAPKPIEPKSDSKAATPQKGEK